MAQFDVFETTHGDLILDCQADLWADYNTRYAVPLLMPNASLPRIERLNPLLQVNGEPRVMMTEFGAAIPVKELGNKVASLAEHDLTIKSAIDMLIQGH